MNHAKTLNPEDRWFSKVGICVEDICLSLAFQLFPSARIIEKMRKLSILPQTKEIGLEASVPQTERTGVKKRKCKSRKLIWTPWPLNTWVFLALLPVVPLSACF